MNLFSNFIPNKLFTLKTHVGWLSILKNKITWRNKIYSRSVRISKDDYHKSKDDYHKQLARKLTYIKTNSRASWSILKTFHIGKKVLLIPPLVINNKLEPYFKRKTDHFNVLALKCKPLKNDSVLPTLLEHESEARFSKIAFTDDQILKILRALDINKPHELNEITIRMLKLCDKSIITLLSILFQNCIDTRTFQDTWKKSNIVPVHKKGDEQIVDNYRPVSLLPILGKKFLKELFSIQFLSILTRIIYFVLISLGSDLLILVNINFSQYCMKFINLLIVITSKCQGYFLRSFKQAFDRVWHDGLIYKIKRIGIAGNSLKLIENFFE